MLPGRRLQPLGGGPPVRIGSNRSRAQVLVVAHSDPCDECAGYLEAFEPVAAAVRAEKGDVLALVGAGWEHHSSLPVPAVIVDGVTLAALSPEGTPVVAVADRFGQLFARFDAGPDHLFPAHEDILTTLLNIGIGCPECGVPDVPSAAVLPDWDATSGGIRILQ